MLPEIRKFLTEGFRIDEERLMKLMEENDCYSFRNVYNQPTTNFEGDPIQNTITLRNYMNNLSSEHNFSIPDEPLFYSFFKLDDPDFLDTYLYTPEFSRMFHFPHSSLPTITNVHEVLTEIFQMSLLGIYEGQKWKIPKLQLYENGKLSRSSEGFVGEDEYDQEYIDGYWDRIRGRADKHIESFVQRLGNLGSSKKGLLK